MKPEIKSKIDSALNELFDKEVKDEFLKQCYEKNKEFLSGGKRLRGIACYEICSDIKMAMAVELVHASTLIHDDIMDEDEIRRGSPSMHKFFSDVKNEVFGTSVAIIQGNILVSMANELVADNSEAVKILNKAYRDVNEGQLLDINAELDEESYIEMVRLKTGGMFAAALELGALIGGKDRELYREFGENAAIAFQIHDDLMDIDPEMEKGNTFGSDIKQGKNTLLMIKAGIKDNTNVSEVVKVMNESGAVDYCKQKEREYIEKAKKITDDEFLIELADYLIKRKK